MKTLKRIILFGLFTVLLLTAVACNSETPDQTDNSTGAETETAVATAEAPDTRNDAVENNNQQTVISFAVNGWERGLYEEHIERFAEEHPDISVELISVDEILDQGGNSVSVTVGGEDDSFLKLAQAADVISWYLSPGQVTEGLLLNLEPLMTGDDNFDSSDYYPGVLEQMRWDGGTWAVPTTASYLLLFYDKDLFDAVGVAYPEAGWSWDDFLAAAQAVTLRNGDEVEQWGFSPQFMGPLELVQAKAGPIFNFENDPPTARLEEPEVVAAFQWFIDLYTEYEVVPYAPPPQSEEDFETYEDIYMLIEEGKVAMWVETAEAYTWRSQQRNIGVVPLPVSNSNMNSSPIGNFGGGTLAISAGTANPQAAWTWIKFLTEQQRNDGFAFGPGGPTSLPARKSVAEVSGVWDEFDEPLAEALRFAVDHGFALVYPTVGGEELYQILGAVIDEGKSVSEALAAAQQAFETGVEEAAQADAEATPIPEFAVAEPPSSQIAEGTTVVSFVVAGGDPSGYRQLAQQFNELHPDIVVQVKEPSFFGGDDFSVQALVGDADSFQWWSPVSGEDDLQAVLPLQPFLDADPDLAEADFFPTALDRYRHQGQVVGLPGEIQVAFLSYNKRLFDAAGVPYPQAGWTMDEFLETAVALTQGDGEEDKVYGYVPDMFELGDVFIFLQRQGVALIDDSIDPPTIRFDSPEFISALRWYTNLTTEYGVKPTFDVTNFTGIGNDPFAERKALIDNDRAALWKDDPYGTVIIGPGGEEEVEASDNSHIGYVPYPVGEDGGAGYESMNGYYIAADTEVRQAAWEWLKFLTTQESLAQVGLPARVSTAESPEYAQRVGAEKAQVLIESVQNSTQTSTSDLFSEGSDWLGPAMAGLQSAYGSIVAEEVTVEEAMQDLQIKVDNYRQCIIENDLIGSNNYQEYEACMQEADLSWEG